jgi:hypothetical protein
VSADTYVFGYPLVLSDRARRNANRLFVSPVIDGTRRLKGWLDLDAEPWVLSLPDTMGRYSVICLWDAWHTAFASVGARTTGTGHRAFAILGPARRGIRLPAGLSPIASPTRLVRMTGCLEATTDADAQLADGIRLAPLSRWHGPDHAAPPALADDADDGDAAAVEQVECLDTTTFLSELFRLSHDNPPEPADRPMLTRARGLLNGERSRADEEALLLGREAVRAAASAPPGEAVGTWRVDYGLGRFGTDYLRRAVAARRGLCSGPATDELSATTGTDAEGRPLTGRERYRLRFPAGGTPPAAAFWSLTTAAGSLSDLRGLVLDADGSLSIRIGPDAPSGRCTNWLPAPAGRFEVTLRLFWPREDALDGAWSPPPITRL